MHVHVIVNIVIIHVVTQCWRWTTTWREGPFTMLLLISMEQWSRVCSYYRNVCVLPATNYYMYMYMYALILCTRTWTHIYTSMHIHTTTVIHVHLYTYYLSLHLCLLAHVIINIILSLFQIVLWFLVTIVMLGCLVELTLTQALQHSWS